MPDNHGRELSPKEAYQQKLRQKQVGVDKHRRLARIYSERWQASIARFPALSAVKTLDAFARAREADPTIPSNLFDDFNTAQNHEEEARKLDAEEITVEEEQKEKKHHRDAHGGHGQTKNEPVYMDHDKRYHELLEADPLVKQFREVHPELKHISSVSELEEGVFGLNPAIIPHLTALDPSFDAFLLEERTREAFRNHKKEEYRAAAKLYAEREKKRIYKNPQLDPELKRLERRVQQKTAAHAATQQGITLQNTPPQQTPFQHAEFAAQTRKGELLHFARNFLQKAQAYVKQLPELTSAVSQVLEEERLGISFAGDAAEYAEEGMTPAEFYEETLSNNDTAEKTVPPPSSSTQEVPDLKSFRRQMPMNPAPGAAPEDTTSPGPGRASPQRPSALRNPLRNPFGNRGKGASSPLGQLAGGLNKAADLIPQVRAAKQTKKVIIIVGIIVLIIFVLFLGGGFGDLGVPGPGSSVPVSISKTVDKETVDNPPNTEDITYTIKVSYPAPADDIIIEDPIPEGAEYVKSEPPGKTLDKDEKETTDVNKVKKVVWSAKNLQQPAESSPTSSSPETETNVDYQKYTQSPYNLPQPNGPSDVDYTAAIMTNLNTLGNAVAHSQSYLQSKFEAKYVDPFLSVIWVGAIEGTFGDPYSWNCQDNRAITINDGCAGGYYSGGWQVGYGIQVSQAASHVAQDFNVAYGDGSADNATKVAEVGQQVIENSASSSKGKITNPTTFPKKTVSALASEANNGNTASQQALAILLMDPNVGAITIAQEVAGDIAGADNWSATMSRWSNYYSDNMQNFSNRMRAIAEKYSGQGSSGSGSTFPTQNLKLIVRAVTSDTYLVNQATTRVIGGRGTDSELKPGNPVEGFQYYCQGDPQWSQTCNIGQAGCGPTSLAMIMSTFGVSVTPDEVDAVFQRNGWRAGCDAGSNYGEAITSTWFTDQGFTVGPNVAPGQQPDLALMKQYLDSGYLIYNGADNYPCLGCVDKGSPVGHVFVIDAVDVSGNRIHVRDPNNCSFSTGEENPDDTRWLSVASGYPGGVQGTTWNGSFPIKKD